MTAPSKPERASGIAAKLLKIGATGLLVTLVYAVLFVLLSAVLSSAIAHVAAYLAAVLLQFLILTTRVFETDGGRRAHLGRAGRYGVQIAVVLILSTAAERLIDLPPVAEAVALAFVITCINALMYFVWTFRR